MLTWWRHQMETFSALLAICAGNSPVPVNSPHKGQWRGTLMFSLICVWINGWVNNREAGDLRRYRGHYDVSVMGHLITEPEHKKSWQTFILIWLHGIQQKVIFHILGEERANYGPYKDDLSGARKVLGCAQLTSNWTACSTVCLD